MFLAETCEGRNRSCIVPLYTHDITAVMDSKRNHCGILQVQRRSRGVDGTRTIRTIMQVLHHQQQQVSNVLAQSQCLSLPELGLLVRAYSDVYCINLCINTGSVNSICARQAECFRANLANKFASLDSYINNIRAYDMLFIFR